MIGPAVLAVAGAVAHAGLPLALAAAQWLPVLLQASGAPGEGAPGDPAPTHVEYRYEKPFLQPLPVWHDWQWPWLLVPLCIGVAVVYKSIKCRYVRQIPREAAVLSVWILLGMASAAVVLAAVVKYLERG